MTETKSPRINYALWWFIIVAAALLVTALTLPLLSRSVAIFGVVAGVCWSGVFGGAVVLTRTMNRPEPEQSADDEADVATSVETTSK